MTIQLVEVLQQPARPYFYTALVEKIRDDGLLDLVMGDVNDPDPGVVRVLGAAYLDSYTPQVFDKVYFMTHETRKTIVFGRASKYTVALADAGPEAALAHAGDWVVLRAQPARRGGSILLNAELFSPPAPVPVVAAVLPRQLDWPDGAPAALLWVSGGLVGGGQVDDVTGEISLFGSPPADSTILISATWSTK
jgi:hypothetical protein